MRQRKSQPNNILASIIFPYHSITCCVQDQVITRGHVDLPRGWFKSDVVQHITKNVSKRWRRHKTSYDWANPGEPNPLDVPIRQNILLEQFRFVDSIEIRMIARSSIISPNAGPCLAPLAHPCDLSNSTVCLFRG